MALAVVLAAAPAGAQELEKVPGTFFASGSAWHFLTDLLAWIASTVHAPPVGFASLGILSLITHHQSLATFFNQLWSSIIGFLAHLSSALSFVVKLVVALAPVIGLLAFGFAFQHASQPIRLPGRGGQRGPGGEGSGGTGNGSAGGQGRRTPSGQGRGIRLIGMPWLRGLFRSSVSSKEMEGSRLADKRVFDVVVEVWRRVLEWLGWLFHAPPTVREVYDVTWW